MESYQPFRITRKSSRRGGILQLGIVLLAAGALALLINMFVFQSYYVDGESMSPTLHTSDRLIISKVEKSVSMAKSGDYTPTRGQIVVIDGEVSPSTASRAPHLIKRVVAVPGDTIKIEKGVAMLYNGEHPKGIDVDQLLGLSLASTYSREPLNVTVPEGSVFVMGDNRAEGGSYDSRSFGLVKSDLIVGRLWVRILPLDTRRVF